jgi:hypothetical protein
MSENTIASLLNTFPTSNVDIGADVCKKCVNKAYYNSREQKKPLRKNQAQKVMKKTMTTKISRLKKPI